MTERIDDRTRGALYLLKALDESLTIVVRIGQRLLEERLIVSYREVGPELPQMAYLGIGLVAMRGDGEVYELHAMTTGWQRDRWNVVTEGGPQFDDGQGIGVRDVLGIPEREARDVDEFRTALYESLEEGGTVLTALLRRCAES